MHLYPRRRNVVAQMAEELKTVTYATPPTKERRKKTKAATMSTSLCRVSSAEKVILHDNCDPAPTKRVLCCWGRCELQANKNNHYVLHSTVLLQLTRTFLSFLIKIQLTSLIQSNIKVNCISCTFVLYNQYLNNYEIDSWEQIKFFKGKYGKMINQTVNVVLVAGVGKWKQHVKPTIALNKMV